MNPQTPMRFLLAAALIVDAIAGHLLYRSAFATPNGEQPVLAATGLSLFVTAAAIAVVMKPSTLSVSLARGIALVMIVGLAGVGFLFFMAAQFESGVPDDQMAEITGLLLLGLGIQITVFATARSVDGRKLAEVMGSAINGAFAFWAVGVVLVVILSLFEGLLVL
jgi:hypothetical protein